jgi:hypothetical protein
MAVIHVIYGLGILLSTPLVFHLTAFRKEAKVIQVLASVLAGEYILTTYLILFGLLHVFDWKLILLASLLTASIVGGFIRNKNIGANSVNIFSSAIGLSILFVLFIFIIQHYTFPAGISLLADFPWARIIVGEGSIPAFHLDNIYYVINKPPLLYTHIALLFSFQGNFMIDITRSISIFYTFFILFLLMSWSREYGKHVPLFVLISLFGVWPLFIQNTSWAIEEIPLLFFTTASFYLLFKHLKTKKDVYLVLLAVSLSLSMLTDIIGYPIFFFVLSALIVKTEERRKTIVYFFLLSIPVLLWVSRNYYFYGTLPLIGHITSLMNKFIGTISTESAATVAAGVKQDVSVSYYFQFIKDVGKDIIAGYPAFFFAFMHMYRNRKEFEKKFIFLTFAFFAYYILAEGHVHYSTNRHGGELIRYMFFFFGVFAVYSGIEMSRLYDALPLKVLKEKKRTILAVLLIFLALYSFGRISMFYTQTDKYDFNAQKGVLEYLSENRDVNERLRVFGELSSVLIWYGDATLIHYPESPLISILSGGERLEYGRDSIYYHRLFSKIGISYVYDIPGYDYLDPIFEKINDDKEHFRLVYSDEKGYRLWKVIAPG